MPPLAVDLCCGLGGWTDGLLAEGFDVIGFDVERHIYGDHQYPAQLVIQDILTLHGSQFRGANLIVASPPCQTFSYMAMPWSRAKAIAAEYRSGERDVKQLTALFDACFRIQREACAAADRHIPLVVENVRGAVPWVGPARCSWGPFYLWGDIPALMPSVIQSHKVPGFRFDGSGRSLQSAAVKHTKSQRRKEASAIIAKIPLALSVWIARCFKPTCLAAEQLEKIISASPAAPFASAGMSMFTTPHIGETAW